MTRAEELRNECDRLWNVYLAAQRERRCPKDIKYCENKYFKALRQYERLSERTVKNYDDKVAEFNKASGASYDPQVHFITFKNTSKGILVGFTVGKYNEVRELYKNIEKAGAPYYHK